MRILYLRLFLAALLTALSLQVMAQASCTGSLGDPVEGSTDFGSGIGPGPPLPAGQTSLFYLSNCNVEDNQYAILNSVTGCHANGWHTVLKDHTGTPNGYMMVVNASFDPSTFYLKKVSNLCPGTTYEFSAYLLNLVRKDVSDNTVKQPNITFSIETTSGQQLIQLYNTGVIEPVDVPLFKKYATYFTTTNETEIILKMTNNAPGGNGNDFIVDDIAFRACGPDIATEFTGMQGQEQNICEGETHTYTLNAAVQDAQPHDYQWQINYNKGSGWQDIDNATGKSFLVKNGFDPAVTGVYQYRAAVSKPGNMASLYCRTYSTPLTINVNARPVVNAVPDQELCEGESRAINASGNAVKYEWYGPNLTDHSNPLVLSNVTIAKNAGSYKVVATSAEGCTTEQSVNIAIKAAVNGIADPVPAICEGESVQLMAKGGTSYKWTPSAGLDHDDRDIVLATPAETTTYTVRISNGICFVERPVQVTVFKKPFVKAPTDKAIFEGQSVRLDAGYTGDNVTGFTWSPTTALDDPASLTPLASPTADITYTLVIQSATCGESPPASVFVRVYKKITIPNTFTPNGDGVNDNWNITALSTYPQSITTVYSRNGQELYRSVGYAKPWDGIYNGAALPVGTYYYIIDLKNNTPKVTGYVTLVK